MKPLKSICALVFLFGYTSIVTAQSSAKRYEIGIKAGTSIYTGDLIPWLLGSYKTPGFAIGINGSKVFNRFWSLRADLSSVPVKSDDAKYSRPEYRQQRNFNFKTSIKEIAVSLVWSPLTNKKIFSPYLLAGAGYSFIKIKKDYSNFNYEYFANTSISEGLVQDIATPLPRGLLVLPVGIGVRYSLTPALSINAESSYRLMSSDYLDGFSKSVNPSKKDNYYSHTVGLIYSFEKKNNIDCPPVKF